MQRLVVSGVVRLIYRSLSVKGLRIRRSKWPHGLRRGSADARLLGLRVRMPPGAWMSVACECAVLSGGDLCNGPRIRTDESYRVCVCVTECVREASKMWGPRSTTAAELRKKKVRVRVCTL